MPDRSTAAVAPHSTSRAEVPAVAPPGLSCPPTQQLRDRLRAMCADRVASWKTNGVPAAVRSASGLRSEAEAIVARAGAPTDVTGWTMVTLVSEHWRDRLATGPSGRRLLLLPDCPALPPAADTSAAPRACGPGCGIATIWAAARDSGWAVESTSAAVAAIGGLLTGQYSGILGVARLGDLQKAFSMVPAFALPIAAVPYVAATVAGDRRCAESLAAAAIDVDWVLGLLGVAGGAAAPVGEYLPLLREAAELFAPAALDELTRGLNLAGMLGPSIASAATGRLPPLATAAGIAGEYLTRGGKFLRPFVTLAAYDAVTADRRGDAAASRAAVRAAAVAIEIFHKASLVHDDIEDDDPVRYGRPALHVECGVASALNAGDYLLGAGYRIMASLPGVDPKMLGDGVAILADAHVRLAKGQGAELAWRDGLGPDRRLSPQEALEIYGLKTSPAFEAAVALGIRLAGVAPDDVAAIDRYALHVGTGFQVLNDLKDWGGDLENDRRAAGDLIGGRPTLLWALAQERLAPPEVARLADVAAVARGDDPDAVALAVGEARDLYARADVVRRAARIAAEQRHRALEAVASCRLPRLRDVLEFLLDLAVPEQAADSA